jgi:hypothetical membrane protein
MGRRRLGAAAGIVGPPLLVVVWVVEGWLRPGYDSRSMYGSELALGPRGIIMVVNLIVYGVLLLLFARGIAAQFPYGTASYWGPRLLGISGLCCIGGGLFVMDPLPTPLAQLSWHGWLHALLGVVLSYALPISCFVFLRRFRQDREWRVLARWTLTAGVLSVALIVVLKAIVWTTRLVPENAAGAWGGLVQRLFFFTWLGWQFAVAVRLHRLARDEVTGATPEAANRLPRG